MKPRGKVAIRLAPKKITAAAKLLVAIAVLVAFFYACFTLMSVQADALDQQAVKTPPTCHSVTAKTYNRKVRELDRLTHRRHHRATHKVCKHTVYKRLLARIKKAKKDCIDRAPSTEASVYWPGGDSGGMIGSCGKYLGNYRYGFAELGMGTYMGHLPCGTIIYVHGPNGKTVAAPKIDIGAGSGSAGRAIDLWNRTGPAVGIGNGIGQVKYSRTNCWK